MRTCPERRELTDKQNKPRNTQLLTLIEPTKTPIKIDQPHSAASVNRLSVFDFAKNWDSVLPHLHDPIVEKVLKQGMDAYIKSMRGWSKGEIYGMEYDPSCGPWWYAR